MNPVNTDPARAFYINGQYYILQNVPVNASGKPTQQIPGAFPLNQHSNLILSQLQAPSLNIAPRVPGVLPMSRQLNDLLKPEMIEMKQQSPPQSSSNQDKQPLHKLFQKNVAITSIVAQMSPPPKTPSAIKSDSMSPISTFSARYWDAMSSFHSPISSTAEVTASPPSIQLTTRRQQTLP